MPTSPPLTERTMNNSSRAKTTEKILQRGDEAEAPAAPERPRKRVCEGWEKGLYACCIPLPQASAAPSGRKKKDCKHNSNWEYFNKSTFVLTSLWKELWVNLFEGFFVNNTAGAFLEKVVKKQYEQSVHKTNVLHIFKLNWLLCKAAPSKLPWSHYYKENKGTTVKFVFVSVLMERKKIADVKTVAYKCQSWSDTLRNTLLLVRAHMFIIKEVRRSYIVFHIARRLT